METVELIKALQDQKAEILKKVHHLDETIELIRRSSSNGHLNGNDEKSKENGSHTNTVTGAGKYAEYDTSSSLKNRMLTIIKAEGRFLHNREIAVIAHSLEPKIDLKTWIGRVSSTLSILKKSGSNLVNYKVGNSNLNVFWGSRNWLNEKGEIKKEHLYDTSQLANSKEEIAI